MKTDDLFQRINAIVPPLAGWCDLDKAHALAATVLALRPKVCVEIGVFGGKSLIPTAMALQAVGGGKIIGIDPWSQVAATEGYEGANAEWWGSRDMDGIHREFIANVARLDLTPFVEVWRARSDDVPPPTNIDMAHLDGQHTDQAVREVHRYADRIRVGGICFMDDTDWVNESTGNGVARAVQALLGLGFVERYKIGTGAAFQRVR